MSTTVLSPRAALDRPRAALARRASRRALAPRAARDDAPNSASNAPEPAPEGMIDRANLDKRYYEGFIKSSLGEDDDVQREGRDTITASVKLGAQATAVLTALTLGFMWSNGLL